VALYQYTAKNLEGGVRRGMLEAADESRLSAKLRDDGLFLVSCRVKTEDYARTRLKAQELSDFSRQIGTMLASGVSLLRAISIISQRDVKPHVRVVYQNLYRALQRGVTLGDAMSQQGEAFPELLINMYYAGESSGKLDQTAMKMAVHYEKEHRLRTKIKSAMTYPLILLFVTLAVMIAIFTMVLPSFFDIFDGAELPLITRIVMAVSNGLINHWIWILIIVLALAMVIGTVRTLLPVRRQMDRVKLRLPAIGKPLKTIYTARFARTLSSLYSSGLSMLNALSISGGTIGNLFISEQMDNVSTAVRQGTALSAAISTVNGFDPKLAATITIGEESGKLDDMLESVADSFDYEADMATQRLTTILEPALIIIMALLIGTIMISVLLPIVDMYQTIA
jgi:type IV pilus assembly protein PilC